MLSQFHPHNVHVSTCTLCLVGDLKSLLCGFRRERLNLHSTDFRASQSGIRALVSISLLFRYDWLSKQRVRKSLQDNLANGRCFQSVENYLTNIILKISHQVSFYSLSLFYFSSYLICFGVSPLIQLSKFRILRGWTISCLLSYQGSIFANLHRHEQLFVLVVSTISRWSNNPLLVVSRISSRSRKTRQLPLSSYGLGVDRGTRSLVSGVDCNALGIFPIRKLFVFLFASTCPHHASFAFVNLNLN